MGEAARLRDGLRLISAMAESFAVNRDYQESLVEVARSVVAFVPDTCIVTLQTADGTLTPIAIADAEPLEVEAYAPIMQQRMSPANAAISATTLQAGPLFFPVLDLDAFATVSPAAGVARLRAIGARGLIVVPLQTRGELHGWISVIRRRAEHPPFDEIDLEIVKNVGHHAAIAIGNAQLHDRLARSEQLRAAEEAAVQASALLDAIVEHIPDMVFVKEAVGLTFVRFNRAGEELLGMPRAALIGKSDFDFFPRSEAEFFVAKDRETLATKALVVIAEEPIQTTSGPRWLHTKKVPLCDAAGTPRYLLGISHDITERKRSEAELRAAIEAAERANEELESFSYSVAHDLRAPLRAIDGFSQAIVEDAGDLLDTESKANFARVRQAAQRMARLIDDLLAMSHIARTHLRRERVDLSALAATTIAGLQRTDAGREVAIVIEPGLVATADPQLISLVFDNLLGNAWKFTTKQPSGRIEVGSTVTEYGRTFFVRDNGAGFDMAYANKLFGVFQRLHSEIEFPGTGIGLATVSRIIRRHHGRVWAEGVPNAGAVFYFTLEEPP